MQESDIILVGSVYVVVIAQDSARRGYAYAHGASAISLTCGSCRTFLTETLETRIIRVANFKVDTCKGMLGLIHDDYTVGTCFTEMSVASV